MLEYTKTVLEKVSFNEALFTKELMKSIQWVQMEDVNQLYAWCKNLYGNRYEKVIDHCFQFLND